MNKEIKKSIIKMYEPLKEQDLVYYDELQKIIDYIWELEHRIDKAIEYMGTHYIDLEYTKKNIGLDNVTLEIKARSLYEILNILKGGNDE